MTILALIITLSFVQNVVFFSYLGGLPRDVDDLTLRRVHVIVLLTVVSIFFIAIPYYVLNRFILNPLGLYQFEMVTFAVIAGFITFGLRRILVFLFPFSVRMINEVQPGLTVNGLVLGITVIATTLNGSIWTIVAGTIAGSLGLYLALIFLTAVRQRMTVSSVSRSFRGKPALFISAGLISLLLAGIDRALLQIFPPLW